MVKFEGTFVESGSQAIVAHGDTVTIPDAHLLFSAHFSRSAHDLILTGHDGKSVIVVDYFSQPHPPALASPEGAILTPSWSVPLPVRWHLANTPRPAISSRPPRSE